MPRVTDLLDPAHIVFSAGNKGDIIAALCRTVTTDAWQRQALERAVLEREEMAATALDCGVAVPHGHIPELDEFVLALAVLDDDLDWDGEGHDVRLVILIGAPEGRQAAYLRLLATIVKLVERAEFRQHLCGCSDADSVVDAIIQHPLLPPGQDRRAKETRAP